MRKPFFAISILVLCLLTPKERAQVRVIRSLKNLGHANVTRNNMFARLGLKSRGAHLPKIGHTDAVSLAANQLKVVSQNTSSGQASRVLPVTVSLNASVTDTMGCKNFQKIRCVDPTNIVGWTGSTVDAWLSAAQTDLAGAGIIQLAPGNYTYAGTFLPASNVSVIGPGRAKATLIASNANTMAPFSISGVTNVTLRGFTVDGKRSANASTFDGVYISNSTNVVVDALQVSNFNHHGVIVVGNSSQITIQRCDIQKNGSATVTATGTAGIAVAPGCAFSISHVRIGPDNSIHDNNAGVQVSNSSSSAHNVEDVSVFDSALYANVNDAILATSNVPSGGKIVGFRAENNEVYCNGWPANGTGFSANCAAGFLQSGPTSSGNGVGVDLIQNGDRLLIQPTVSGNNIHDNVFEGIATATQAFSMVSTNGTAVTWTAGTSVFNTNWRAGQIVLINNVAFKIAAVSSGTALTLQTSAGTQTGVGFAGPSFMWASIVENQLVHNGNSLLGVGPGIYCQLSDGNTYASNVAISNNFEGIELFDCSFASVSGDRAFSNNTSSTYGRGNGFASYGGFGNTFWGVVTDELVMSPRQTIGIMLDANSANNLVFSTSLFGSGAALNNMGTGNIYVNPPTITGNLRILLADCGPREFSALQFHSCRRDTDGNDIELPRAAAIH